MSSRPRKIARVAQPEIDATGAFGSCDRSKVNARASIGSLPHDIIYHIVNYLDVLDLISLEKVLPWLSDPTASYSIWARLYRSSTLPRPPGPLPLANIASHIATLQQGACIDRAWAAARAVEAKRPSKWIYSAMQGSGSQLGARRTFDLPINDSREARFSLVFGRWLFVGLTRENRVVCYDLNASHDSLAKYTEVYKATGEITHFACAESTGLDGQPIAFAVVKEKNAGSSVSNLPHVIRISKIEAPPFSSSAGIGQVRLREVLVSPVAWQSAAFTVSLSPTLLLVADDSRRVDDSGILCMGAASFERYQLALVPAFGLYTHLAITFVPCTTHLLVIRVFMRGTSAEVGSCVSVIDAFTISRSRVAPQHPAVEAKCFRLAHTHRGTVDLFIRDAKLLEDPAFAAASAGVVPENIAALRGFRKHTPDSKLAITTTIVGIRDVADPLHSSFLGTLRVALAPVDRRMELSRALSERNLQQVAVLARTFSVSPSMPLQLKTEATGKLAVEYTPLYILPSPLRLPFFQPAVNGSMRGITLLPLDDQEQHEADSLGPRSSSLLPIFEGICIRLNDTNQDDDQSKWVGANSFAHHRAFQPLRPPSVPVKIDVTSLPYMLTIFPPTLLAFDGVRGRMVFLRLGPLSPMKLEHRLMIEIWDR